MFKYFCLFKSSSPSPSDDGDYFLLKPKNEKKIDDIDNHHLCCSCCGYFRET